MSEQVLVPGGGKGGEGAGADSPARRDRARLWTRDVWSVIGWIGFVLAAMGLVDVFLTWYPFDFGNVEWEFGTVSQSFNGLPSVTMGLGLWLGSAVVLERKVLARLIAIAFVGLAVAVVVAAVLYATTVPIALNSVPENAVATGLRKAIAKTAAQSVLYPVVFLVIGIKGWKSTSRIE